MEEMSSYDVRDFRMSRYSLAGSRAQFLTYGSDELVSSVLTSQPSLSSPVNRAWQRTYLLKAALLCSVPPSILCIYSGTFTRA